MSLLDDDVDAEPPDFTSFFTGPSKKRKARNAEEEQPRRTKIKPSDKHSQQHGMQSAKQPAQDKQQTKAKATATSQPAAKSQTPAPKLVLTKKGKVPKAFWNFPTDYNDHFETSYQALLDIEALLKKLCRTLNKGKQHLKIYDPFYCQGSIRQHYEQLGYTHFIHENRDFYKDVKEGTVPDYDILITNPPYSDDHKERILDFCAKSRKPWALLMPNYVANKQYFTDAVHRSPISKPFYITPTAKYEYQHPEGTGHDQSPFSSMWYIWLGQHMDSIFSACKQTQQQAAGSPGVHFHRSLAELREGKKVPTEKRLNPKQRQKLKAKRGLT